MLKMMDIMQIIHITQIQMRKKLNKIAYTEATFVISNKVSSGYMVSILHGLKLTEGIDIKYLGEKGKFY